MVCSWGDRNREPIRLLDVAASSPPTTTSSTNHETATKPESQSKSTMLTRMAAISLVLSALSLSAVQAHGQQLSNILQQYRRSTQNLVNAPPPPGPQAFYPNVESLALTRPQIFTPQVGPTQVDLDNVIESTTADSLQLAFATGLALRSAQQSAACQLPPTWAGRWYQANKEPIRVTNTEISDKGICRDKKGDKYLFEYSKQAHQTCLICLVINERHLNVLQYKESSCQPVPAQYLNRTTITNSQLIIDNDHSLLDSICSDITGDAPLESLFRLDTPSIECPINGKYHFTYDQCGEPKSSLDSCIDKKQLHFKYSACPDMAGSESKCK